jgi:hypothetical protein
MFFHEFSHVFHGFHMAIFPHQQTLPDFTRGTSTLFTLPKGRMSSPFRMPALPNSICAQTRGLELRILAPVNGYNGI